MLPLVLLGVLGWALARQPLRRTLDPWGWGPPRLPPEWRDIPPDEPPPKKRDDAPPAGRRDAPPPDDRGADNILARTVNKAIRQARKPEDIRRWRGYPAPIPRAVVARAEELLRGGMRPGQAPIYAPDERHGWVQYRPVWLDAGKTKRGVAALVPAE